MFVFALPCCIKCFSAVKSSYGSNGIKTASKYVLELIQYLGAADFLVSAAVAEFKGPVIFGVVRFAQVNMELARIEANFSGLSPGKHAWSINEFGDLTRGAASTGKVFNPTNQTRKEVGLLHLLLFSLWT